MAAFPRFVEQPTATNANVVRIEEEGVCGACDRELPAGSSMIWDPIGRALTCRGCQLADALSATPAWDARPMAAPEPRSTTPARRPARPLLARVTNVIWGEPAPEDDPYR